MLQPLTPKSELQALLSEFATFRWSSVNESNHGHNGVLHSIDDENGACLCYNYRTNNIDKTIDFSLKRLYADKTDRELQSEFWRVSRKNYVWFCNELNRLFRPSLVK